VKIFTKNIKIRLLRVSSFAAVTESIDMQHHWRNIFLKKIGLICHWSGLDIPILLIKRYNRLNASSLFFSKKGTPLGEIPGLTFILKDQ
jgi:hypothetical protein